jgi:hypothetical protein
MAHIWNRHLEQAGDAVIKNALIITAGLVCEGAGNPAFSQACWSCDPQIFMAVEVTCFSSDLSFCQRCVS